MNTTLLPFYVAFVLRMKILFANAYEFYIIKIGVFNFNRFSTKMMN